MQRHRLTPLIGALLWGCIEVAPLESCPEYDAAMALLDEISSATLDPTLGDPRFLPVVAALEKVGPGCKQHQAASTSAATIRAAMAKRGQAPAPTPTGPQPAAAPLTGAKVVDEAERQAIQGYLQQVEIISGSAKHAEVQGLLQEGIAKSGQFGPVIAEITKIEGQLQRVKVPASCAAFHQANLQLARTSRSSLEALHRAIADKDDAAIKSIQEQIPAQKEEITRVEAMRAELRARLGP